MENGEWKMGVRREAFAHFPFSILHFPFLRQKKSLRNKKRIPILSRHKRMALLLPA
jgi:hypothetical protein